MECYSTPRRKNPLLFDNIDETGGYYAKWNKPDRERWVLYTLVYMLEFL